MKQITVNKYHRKPDQSSSALLRVGSEAKNPLLTTNNSSISATDMIGLSWIFSGEEYF